MTRYDFEYPSGKKFYVDGLLRIVPLGDMMVPMIEVNGNPVVFDQRAIIKAGDQVVYSPRRNADGLDPGFSAWMNEHPEWDPVQGEA